jgi:hypothetical protein
MNPLSILVALPLLVLAVAGEPAGKGSASGTFNFREKNYSAVDAMAWRDGGFLKVVLSDKPLDRAAMGEDGIYSDVDLMNHAGASLTITIDAEKREFVSIRLRNDTGHGADFRCEGPGLLTVTKADATAIAGRFKCMEHDVTFDAPVLKPPKPAAS